MQAFISLVEPHSSSIWRGKNSFVIYFAGCNFNCPFCNSPHTGNSKDEFLVDLKDIRKQIKDSSADIDAVFFSGAEPCLQRQALMNLAGYAKELGVNVGIVTNGSKPDCIRSMIDAGFLDYIAMDLKSPHQDDLFQKLTKSSTFFITTGQLIDDLTSTLGMLKKNDRRIGIEFRTTVVPGLMFKKEDLASIANLIKDIECRWVLQRFQPENVKSKSFSQLHPPSESFMENLKESVVKAYPGLRIEIS